MKGLVSSMVCTAIFTAPIMFYTEYEFWVKGLICFCIGVLCGDFFAKRALEQHKQIEGK